MDIPQNVLDQIAAWKQQQEAPVSDTISTSAAAPVMPTPAIPATPPSQVDSIATLLGQKQQQLAEAQQQRNNLQLLTGLSKASAQIGQGIAGATKDTTQGFDQFHQLAERPVSDFESSQKLLLDTAKQKMTEDALKKEMERTDPKSQSSKTFRDFVSNINPSLKNKLGKDWDMITAGDKDLVFDAVKLKETLEERKLKAAQLAELTKARLDEKARLSEEKTAKEKEKDISKRVIDFGKDLDPNKNRTGEMGKNQARINAAERVEALITQFPDYNIPKIQQRELATAVGALLSSGSQTAVTQINELVPHTMQGKASSIAEWITGNPTGQQQQAFMKLYHETAIREREVAEQQKLQAQFDKAYGTHKKLLKDSPEEFYNALSTFTKIPVEDIQAMESKPGFIGKVTKHKELKDEDKQAIEWAKKNPTDPRAKKILQIHGM